MRRGARGIATMAEKQELKRIVRSVLEEVFGDDRIGDVYVASAYDEDGDEILRVRVVFDGTEEQFDARKASSVVRHMRPRLATIGEQAFPIISYCSSDEIDAVRDAVR